MRFSRKQMLAERAKAIEKFRYGRFWCFLSGLLLGLVGGIGGFYFLSVYAIVLTPR